MVTTCPRGVNTRQTAKRTLDDVVSFPRDGPYRTPARTQAVTLSIGVDVCFSRVFAISLPLSFPLFLSLLSLSLCLSVYLFLPLFLFVLFSCRISLFYPPLLFLSLSFFISGTSSGREGSLPVSAMCLTAPRSVVTFAQSRDPLSLSTSLFFSLTLPLSLSLSLALSLSLS